MTAQERAENKVTEIALTVSRTLSNCENSLVEVKHGHDAIGEYYMVVVQIRYKEGE